MAQYNLGQAVMVHRGAYNDATSYDLLNIVSYKGGAYFCIQAGAGHAPDSAGGGAYWAVITKGIDSVDVTADGGVVTMVVHFSDGSTYTATYPTTAIPGGTITPAMLSQSFVLPVNKGGTGGTTVVEARGNLYAQQTHVQGAVTLQVQGWVNGSQTVSFAAMTTSATVFAAPANASREGWNDNGVYCSAQGEGTLTFSCESEPDVDITVNIAMFEVGAGSDPGEYIDDLIGGAY